MNRDIESKETICFDAPAKDWNETLPVGNGRLGAMIYADPYTECMQLNEDSIWYGGPQDRNNKSAKEYLPQIRKLIFAGEIAKAQDLCALALSGTPEEQRHYEPMANLYLLFDGEKSEITNYHRRLNLANAVHELSFEKEGVTYKREVLVSYPKQVIAIHLTANRKGALSFHTQLARGPVTWDLSPHQTQIFRHPNYNAYADSTELLFDDVTVLTAGCGGKGAVEFCCALKVIAKGGVTKGIGNSIVVKEADEVLLLLAAETTFRTDDTKKKALDRLHIAEVRGWQELYDEHVADYQSLYNRVSLNLEDTQDELPVELFFNYGRYLLISSSRPGALPANLQGIWNKDYLPMWGSKFTININTQMNYWPAEICNLSECHLPLMDHIERMYDNGKRTAQEMYGCRGFMAHHNTDIWGDTAPQDVCLSSTYWMMGAAWLCLHIWEHYMFTEDIEFLRRYIELMMEAARFVLDVLVKDEEYLVLCPTISPENEYILPSGEKGVLCKGASMDHQIIRELFWACQKAAGILGIENDVTEGIAQVLCKIPPISIGKYGQIMEWSIDYDEADPGHRHISQLFALHPGTQISVKKTPELAQAAKSTIERRLAHGGGHTGWSRAWIINMWARLREGDKALENIEELLRSSTLPNLLDNHPPFQIDGNFGATSGIAEMLLQSHEDCILLLPALPCKWKSGSVTGLRARGGFTVDMKWKDGTLLQADICADKDTEAKVCYNSKEVIIEIKAGEKFSVSSAVMQ